MDRRKFAPPSHLSLVASLILLSSGENYILLYRNSAFLSSSREILGSERFSSFLLLSSNLDLPATQPARNLKFYHSKYHPRWGKETHQPSQSGWGELPATPRKQQASKLARGSQQASNKLARSEKIALARGRQGEKKTLRGGEREGGVEGG